MSVDEHITRCYAKAVELDAMHIPYLYGGDSIAGYDCSKADSAVLIAGGLISSPLGTHELEHAMDSGIGEYMTLWVANTEILEHSLLEFDMPGHGQQWWAARTKGTLVGFFPLSGGRDYLVAAGFRPRRRP